VQAAYQVVLAIAGPELVELVEHRGGGRPAVVGHDGLARGDQVIGPAVRMERRPLRARDLFDLVASGKQFGVRVERVDVGRIPGGHGEGETREDAPVVRHRTGMASAARAQAAASACCSVRRAMFAARTRSSAAWRVRPAAASTARAAAAKVVVSVVAVSLSRERTIAAAVLQASSGSSSGAWPNAAQVAVAAAIISASALRSMAPARPRASCSSGGWEVPQNRRLSRPARAAIAAALVLWSSRRG
jgi:hypothetical protein